MAKFVVDNKLYNTETANLLCEGKKQWAEFNIIFNRDIYPYRDTQLYKTEKGSFFFVYEKDYGNKFIHVCTEQEAKEFLIYRNLDKYEEMYGKLEEA